MRQWKPGSRVKTRCESSQADFFGRQRPVRLIAYQADILTALVNSGIQQLAPGGKARALCDILADQLGQLEARQFGSKFH